MDIRRYFNRSEVIDDNLNEIERSTELLSVNDESPSIQNDSIAIGDSITTHGIEYEFIPGKRKNSTLVYLKKEKFIFTPINADPKNGKRYTCSSVSCPAKIVIRPCGTCEISKRSKPHNIHSDHSQLRDEYIAIKQIKEKCSNVDELCGGSGINVSVKSIFDNETIR